VTALVRLTVLYGWVSSRRNGSTPRWTERVLGAELLGLWF
jgi:hypothetical protein